MSPCRWLHQPLSSCAPPCVSGPHWGRKRAWPLSLKEGSSGRNGEEGRGRPLTGLALLCLASLPPATSLGCFELSPVSFSLQACRILPHQTWPWGCLSRPEPHICPRKGGRSGCSSGCSCWTQDPGLFLARTTPTVPFRHPGRTRSPQCFPTSTSSPTLSQVLLLAVPPLASEFP